MYLLTHQNIRFKLPTKQKVIRSKTVKCQITLPLITLTQFNPSETDWVTFRTKFVYFVYLKLIHTKTAELI